MIVLNPKAFASKSLGIRILCCDEYGDHNIAEHTNIDKALSAADDYRRRNPSAVGRCQIVTLDCSRIVAKALAYSARY